MSFIHKKREKKEREGSGAVEQERQGIHDHIIRVLNVVGDVGAGGIHVMGAVAKHVARMGKATSDEIRGIVEIFKAGEERDHPRRRAS
jgi:hypothetical protein